MLAESSTRGSVLHAATSRSSKTPLEYGLELTGEVLLYRQFSIQDSGLDSVGHDFRQENIAETDHYSVGQFFRLSHRLNCVCFSDSVSSFIFFFSFFFLFILLAYTSLIHYSVFLHELMIDV